MIQVQRPSLAELQQWLRWVITDPRGVSPALTAEASGVQELRPRYVAPKPSCLGALVDAPPLPLTARLDIYAEGYFARLVESLALDYEALRRVLGEEDFDQLCADYLKCFPSHTPNIGEAGLRLPEFLKTHEFTKDRPWLADLARFECAVLETFYAEKSAPFGLEGLARITESEWPSVRFGLDASAKLLRLDWAIESLWRSRTDTILAQTPAQQVEEVLLQRNDAGVTSLVLEPLQWEILSGMRAGKNLTEICDELQKSLDSSHAAPPLMEWFQQWASDGIIKSAQTETG